MMKTEDRKDWQADPKQITSPQVTVWNAHGTMMTASMSLDRAKDLVARGRAFIVSNGHIGMCDR